MLPLEFSRKFLSNRKNVPQTENLFTAKLVSIQKTYAKDEIFLKYFEEVLNKALFWMWR